MTTTGSRRRHKGGGISFSHAATFVGGMIVGTMFLIIFQASTLHSTEDLNHFAAKHLQSDSSGCIAPVTEEAKKGDDVAVHDIAGLDCSAHGGPNSLVASQELVYWRDIPEDSSYVSPLANPKQRQYLTFEPDGGGWNNIRMSMETVVGIAIATGRVLVLPPSQKMYLLGKSSFSFAGFFPLQEIAKEHAGFEILTMEQFLEETAGTLVDQSTNEISSPPGGRTDWDGDTDGVKHKLNPWLQSIAMLPDWNPETCLAAFPKSRDPKDAQELIDTFAKVVEDLPEVDSFINQPTPVDAPLAERFAEMAAGRKELCVYDAALQDARVVHFHGKKKLGARLLVHFYAFLFFQDYHTDIWMKRFVRDHVRYIDEIQCAAARVLEAVREHSKAKGNGGAFDAFHIRRGDFQYKRTRVDADKIYEAAKDEIPEGATVYIGTDERDKSFFAPMAAHWDLLYLDDFMPLLKGIEGSHFGMLDQLITSRGRVFFGCWFSTFTGYIMRLRGYDSQNTKADGYDMGLLPSTYYYVLAHNKKMMHDYWPVKKLFYAREFPVSWRDIDQDVK
eukprot:Nitzschia sp. Nitz4//scaffold284_size24204//2522//4439//NITZ4_008412-RA/size24204-augustus-gene-0.4-mRNA-1//-1//CDS//3329545676//7367//frame0